MICPKEAPRSLWKLPEVGTEVCPPDDWHPHEAPKAGILFDVFRFNTLQHNTTAFQCTCSRIRRIRTQLFPSSYPSEVETIDRYPLTAEQCQEMVSQDSSMFGNLQLSDQGNFKSTNKFPKWPKAVFGYVDEVENCFVFETSIYTRYGSTEIRLPIGSTQECTYEQGSCVLANHTFTWTPIEEPSSRISLRSLTNSHPRKT